MSYSEASRPERSSTPTRDRDFLRLALVLAFLLTALVVGSRCKESSSLPVTAIRWFLGLDEADKFAIPLHPKGTGVDS